MTIDVREPAESQESTLRRFRKGSPPDADALCEVRELALRATGVRTYTPRQLDAWVRSRDPASFASALSGDDEIFIVAEDADPGRLSGFASVIIRGRPHLWSLYVHPSRQGRGSACSARPRRSAGRFASINETWPRSSRPRRSTKRWATASSANSTPTSRQAAARPRLLPSNTTSSVFDGPSRGERCRRSIKTGQ